MLRPFGKYVGVDVKTAGAADETVGAADVVGGTGDTGGGGGGIGGEGSGDENEEEQEEWMAWLNFEDDLMEVEEEEDQEEEDATEAGVEKSEIRRKFIKILFHGQEVIVDKAVRLTWSEKNRKATDRMRRVRSEAKAGTSNADAGVDESEIIGSSPASTR
eukprot:7387487-Prymnesium_polylepis.1